MAATIDILTRSFAGYRTEEVTVVLEPTLPTELHRLRFAVQHRGLRIRIALEDTTLTVTADHCAADPRVRLRVGVHDATLSAGTLRRFRRETDGWHQDGGDRVEHPECGPPGRGPL